MKPLRNPAILLALLYLCFLGVWAWSGTQLPDRVATHFNLQGEPNGWMSRPANQVFMLIFGLVFPLFVVGLSFAAQFLPASLINVPNREYWLAPERANQTSGYFVRHSLWFACLAVGFVTGIEYSIVQANQQSSPRLSTPILLVVVGYFLAGTFVWVAVLFQHFRRPRQAI
ncbi:conserved membrane hypothetical protein [Verrucomicrobia bacterium]|nr:conserved membrane hypothetical protein [Verrucomicrobiota bacterium]